MGTYDSMKNRLASTGLYSLNGTTIVDDELQAYAAGLDPLCDALNTLQKESFISTAESYGLNYREQVCNITQPQSGNENRRAALLAVSSITPNDDTKEDLEKFLAAFGLSVQLSEDIPNKTITARFLQEPACGRKSAQTLLEKFMPAHLTIVPDYSGLS